MTTTDSGRPLGGLLPRLSARAFTPVDAASLAVFRVLFGALVFVGTVRFVAEGWVHKLYVVPTFFFKYPGFSWLDVPGPAGLYAHFALIGLAALLVMFGCFTRVSFGVLAVSYGASELYDVTNYLNHHLLIIWLAALGVVVPTERAWSFDAWRARRSGAPLTATVPAWAVGVVRFQVAVVYLFAALAKLGPDWLLYGQPLGIWLRTRTDLPLLGPLFALPAAPLVMSWAGFLYDLTIVGWLSWSRTRPWAYVAVVVFHAVTSMLFDIGLFPPLMVVATTVFFAPSWPRELGRRLVALAERGRATRAAVHRPTLAPASPRYRGAVLAGLTIYALLHVAVPLRHYALAGDVLWDEVGMRYAWKVMVREKNGSVTYRVAQKDGGRQWHVSPHDYLTWRQAQEMSGQPDLIAQLARHIRWDFQQRGLGDDVEVRVDALVSLNGRPPAPLIDPTIDLAAVEEAALPEGWITTAPTVAPLQTKIAKRGAW